ncbi:hypothetical protein ACFLY9_00995 [Patescibacteria group bacterium]
MYNFDKAIQQRTIYLSNRKLRDLISNWTDYYLQNPEKSFRLEKKTDTYKTYINQIKKSKGFQLVAFAGKAQNEYTHPSRLPDLGELNLLTKIRAIQLLSKRPARIIFDGEYYTQTFKEDELYIKNYNKAMIFLTKLVGINKEYKTVNATVTVNDLLKSQNLPIDYPIKEKNKFLKNPTKAYEEIELYPKELFETVKRILPVDMKKLLKYQLENNGELEKICSEFIILKAILARIVDNSRRKDKYQRITILKYSHTTNPRINLEMNIVPWNSTILLKNSYLNINTAINASYRDLYNDPRNYIIIGEKNYFWGFSRKRNIFKNL